jgi:cytochrome oxidase Cu insertion factor (SCO1/SenC/PrrC family)
MKYANNPGRERCRRQWGLPGPHPLVLMLLCGALGCGSEPEPQKIKDDAGPVDSAAGSPATSRPEPESKSQKSEAAEPSEPPVLLNAPDFSLTDQLGEAFGSDDLRGHVWVANFMFTQCTATCPRQTAKIADLERRAARWPDWERIHLISFSVDPERDSVAKLREYANLHQADHEHWKFLTGKRAELFRISKDGFKLPVSEAARDGSKPITHSPQFILVDAEGRVRGYYDSQSEEDFSKLLADLRSVLSLPTKAARGTVHVPVPPEIFDTAWLEQRKAEQLATADGLGVYHDFEFTDRLEASGIKFVSRAIADAGRDFKRNHYDHATGITAADVDGDGLYDLYFVSQVGGSELWRNLGQGRFENITGEAGVGLAGRVGVTASFADTDNDGDPDLFVTTTRHGNAFFENDGRGHFRNVTADSGLDYAGHSSSAEFFDYDRDGRLDLFLVNVGQFTTDEVGYSGNADRKEHPYFVGSEKAFSLHLFPERSERSILYHNEGENRFRDVSEEMGLVHESWSGDATPIDLNEDGWTDIYVLGMQGNDEYYENVGGRKFERKSEIVFPRSPWGAMGVKSFDFNNDGHLDLFITNMHADMWKFDISAAQEKQKPPQDTMPESYLHSRNPGNNVFGNALYENRGGGKIREVSDDVNAENYWPWGLSVGDLNADGYQDVLITSSMNLPFRYHINSLLLNGHGKKFHDAEFILGVEPRRDGRTATPWFELDCSGGDAEHKHCAGRSGRVVVWGALGSRSSVIFDLDQDGDLDIVTNDFNSPPLVLTSNLTERNPELRYLKIQLQGTRSNRDGLGAKVQLTAGADVLTQVHDGQSGYLSQSSLPLYFGIPAGRTVDKIAVHWPSGRRQLLQGPIPTNQQMIIVEEEARP